jgi:hypothetical protein
MSFLQDTPCGRGGRGDTIRRPSSDSYSGDTLLNSEAVFELWGVIFPFMLKEEEKISMVSQEFQAKSAPIERFFTYNPVTKLDCSL